MCAHAFGPVKELNDVGRDLTTRVGNSQANREKNRYPYILPCKYKASQTRADHSKHVCNV